MMCYICHLTFTLFSTFNTNWWESFTYVHNYLYIGRVDINIEASSALGSVHELTNYLLDDSALESFIDGGASGDRGFKCSVSDDYHHIGRRRFVAMEVITVNNQSTQLYGCLANTII